MKANGSRREEEKISRKKSGASPGRREKQSVGRRGRWAGVGVVGRCGGRGAALGGRRVREPAPERSAAPATLPAAPSLTLVAASVPALSTTPARAARHSRVHLSRSTLHVQSAQLSASHPHDSAPAAFFRDGTHLHNVQG